MAVRSLPASRATPRPALPSPAQVASLLRAWVRARATRRLLAEMDPRQLADIGVSRGDALMESRRPFWDLHQHR